MKKNDNIKAFEQALKDYLQPILDEHFTLDTWAHIWAHDVYGTGSDVFDGLLRHLPACYEIDGSAYSSKGSNPWDAICELSIGVSLSGHELPFKVLVNRGIVVEVEVNYDEFPVDALDLDLVRKFEKHLTWVAVSKSRD